VKAAGYIRVSTDEQVKHGWNLAEDRELIREKCETKGWELAEVFDDGGLQGDDPTRPELLRLLDSLDQFDVVVMRSLDRLSRDLGIYSLAVKALKAAGVGVECFTGPVDLDTPQGALHADMLTVFGKFEKAQIGQRVKQAMRARARAGLHPGGPPPYGYRWEDKSLVVVPHEKEVVKRIYRDYINGMGQRAVVRALNESNIPTRHGGPWQQSAVVRVLSSVIYVGRLSVKGEVMPGAHGAIISDETWNRAQDIRTGALRRKGGRHPEGGHLLARGVLRCTCGSAMIPRKARAGVERDRYMCRGRIEHGPEFCSQPSIRRELIDEPFLAHLLDGYIDLEATRKRIQERTASALTLAQEALTQAEREAASAEAKLARVRGHYQDGKIEADDWAEQRPGLTAGLEAAREAVLRAQEHVQQTEQTGVVGDAEHALLDHLAALKKAVTAGVGAAPDLAALRNVIGQIFESVQLVRWEDGFYPNVDHAAHRAAIERLLGEHGAVEVTEADPERCRPSPRPRLAIGDAKQHYWLFPKVRWSAVDQGTLSPIGHEMPVGSIEQYPPSVPNPFLCRYCWW
jgi:site-specific DNA recombinase